MHYCMSSAKQKFSEEAVHRSGSELQMLLVRLKYSEKINVLLYVILYSGKRGFGEEAVH